VRETEDVAENYSWSNITMFCAWNVRVQGINFAWPSENDTTRGCYAICMKLTIPYGESLF
jgi:hypothetical protein